MQLWWRPACGTAPVIDSMIIRNISKNQNILNVPIASILYTAGFTQVKEKSGRKIISHGQGKVREF